MRAGFSVRAMVRLLSVLFAMACCGATPLMFAAGEGTKPNGESIESAFSSTVARINVPSRDQAVLVTWTYKNLWGFPMMVERFEESCGCLSGQATRHQDAPESVAPGESGEIRAMFTPGTLRGVQRKSLHVRFVGHDQPVELVAEANIPASVQLSSQQLNWEPAEKAEAKTIDVTSGTGVDFSITGLVGAHDSQFSVIQETVTPRRHYRLHITPANPRTTEGVSAAIQIRTDSPDQRDQVLVLLLRQSPQVAELP